MPAASDSSQPLLICIGTRPEIIKMAPVCRALRARGVPYRLLHTGQHDALAEPIYRELDLEPDARLALNRGAGTLAELSARLLCNIDSVLAAWQPSALLVHGDTTSATAAALAGFYRGVPVGHVEAGLRSHIARDPFPEELHRSLIARIAAWHFAPTAVAHRNLLREGIEASTIHVVGNTIVEATLQARERLHNDQHSFGAGVHEAPPGPRGFANGANVNKDQRLVLVTAHRRENWGAPVAGLVQALATLAQAHEEALFVWPLHANPVLCAQVRRAHASLPAALADRVQLIPALDYFDMIELLSRSWLVLTDSGGLQEEACALAVPILILRDHTERPEVIESGAGRLVGNHPLRIVEEVESLWREPARHQAMRAVANPFGDGLASARIAKLLADWFNSQKSQPAPQQGAIDALRQTAHHTRVQTNARALHAQAGVF